MRFSSTAAGSSPTCAARLSDAKGGSLTPPVRSVKATTTPCCARSSSIGPHHDAVSLDARQHWYAVAKPSTEISSIVIYGGRSKGIRMAGQRHESSDDDRKVAMLR